MIYSQNAGFLVKKRFGVVHVGQSFFEWQVDRLNFLLPLYINKTVVEEVVVLVMSNCTFEHTLLYINIVVIESSVCLDNISFHFFFFPFFFNRGFIVEN